MRKLTILFVLLTLSVGMWAEIPTRNVAIVEIYNGDQLLYRAFEPTSVKYLQEQVPIYEYVDLGLPSGTLWSTTNIGADSVHQVGSYFMWGGITSDVESYDWAHYPYGESEWILTKYCTQNTRGKDGFVDNITVLLPEDDAATQNRGPEWRTPTIEEWQELNNKDYIVQEAVTDYRGTGVGGVIVYKKTKEDGATYYPAMDDHIFLPGGGCYKGTLIEYNSVFYNVEYWSSTLNAGSCSMALDKKGDSGYGAGSRYFGRPIRPVYVGTGNKE